MRTLHSLKQQFNRPPHIFTDNWIFDPPINYIIITEPIEYDFRQLRNLEIEIRGTFTPEFLRRISVSNV